LPGLGPKLFFFAWKKKTRKKKLEKGQNGQTNKVKKI
jgi:hypothetical protein